MGQILPRARLLLLLFDAAAVADDDDLGNRTQIRAEQFEFQTEFSFHSTFCIRAHSAHYQQVNLLV